MSVDPVVKGGKFKGWKMISTGGGCHAFYLSDPAGKGYYMATDLGGCMFPPPRARRVLLCKYTSEGFYVAFWEVPPAQVADVLAGKVEANG